MGWWQINADTLAGSRFVFSPLAETIACLKSLESGRAAHPGEGAWLDTHRPAYQERMAADPVTALLVKAALGRRWNADFLTPTPAGAENLTFDEELVAVREAPAASVRADLVVSRGGRALPDRLHRSDLAERAAELLRGIWTDAVAPSWPSRRRILEADVVARTGKLSRGGWAAALGDLRPEMRWLGDGRLQINGQDNPPREVTGAQLLFVPVTPSNGWVSWDGPRRYAVVYPCAGPLAGQGGTPVPDALGRLLGPARAQVLILLEAPKSTTQLVALTGQGLGSVGRHLKVLFDAGLVVRRRAGRSVLYCRTPAGDTLVAARARAGD